MKRVMKHSLIVLAVVMMFTFGYSQNTSAKSKGKKITYTIKKGTLTIQGNGKMPKSMRFSKNKTIKKVIIKKGITSIPKRAFWKCENLKKIRIANTVERLGFQCLGETGIKSIIIPSSVKTIETEIFYCCKSLTKVTMPGDFEFIKNGNEDYNPRIFYPAKIVTIRFNSPLKLENLVYMPAKNWNVWKKDKQYKSIQGVIYSKDGKDIVRVPSKRKTLKIAKGCTTFCLSSIFYGFHDVDKGIISRCQFLERITIPKTVTKIEDTKYRTGILCEYNVPLKQIKVKSKKIDKESILTFTKYIKNAEASCVKIEDLRKMFPNRIKNVNGCYIMDGTILIGYQGTNTKVEVPQGVTTITNDIFSIHTRTEEMKENKWKIILPNSVKIIKRNAFYNTDISEIKLPQRLEVIEGCAFMSVKLKKIEIPPNIKKIGKGAFTGAELEEVVLPNDMSIIPEAMFALCENLKKVNIPAKLTTIKKEAFLGTKVNIQEILNKKTLKYIGENAFGGMEWKKLTIPEHIKSIKENAFWGVHIGKNIVTIQGNTENYAETTFGDFQWNDDENYIELKFKKGIQQAFAPLYINMLSYAPEQKSSIEVTWIGVKNVDGYFMEVSGDKDFQTVYKKVMLSKKIREKEITVKYKNKRLYARIRPYKIVKNKKVYGRWTTAR